MSGQDLGDILSGAAGAPINRNMLNLQVAQSQARNGLVSAQTQDAILKAQQAQEEQDAHGRIEQSMLAANPDMKPSEASLAKDLLVGHFGGDAVTALKALGTLKLGFGNPTQQTSGQQMVKGELAPPVAVPDTSIMPPNSGLSGVTPTTTAHGDEVTRHVGAQADLAEAQANNPELFHPKSGVFGSVPPEGQAAITKAVNEGRLDPMRVNSRTAPIFAQMELNTPGMNFNGLHADASLQSNPTFQQRAMSVDMLPGLLSHVTALGKKLNDGAGYSDLKTVGMMQKWVNGQVNDPDYTEFMTARNDTLLRLASVMRGVGMSDQAHTAEIEAMSPTLAPYALDAWLKGQMSVVTPLLERQNRVTNLGGKRGASSTPPAAPPTSTPEAPTGAQAMPDAATLQEYARVHFNGDVGKATQYLTSQGFK
jgi:hypothetical protein